MYVIQHCFICRPSDSTVSEDARIKPRTVLNLTVDLLYSGDVGGDGGARPPAHQDQRPVTVRVLNLSNLQHKIRILSQESAVISDKVTVIKEDRYYRSPFVCLISRTFTNKIGILSRESPVISAVLWMQI